MIDVSHLLGVPYLQGSSELEKGGLDCWGIICALYEAAGEPPPRLFMEIDAGHWEEVPISQLQPLDIGYLDAEPLSHVLGVVDDRHAITTSREAGSQLVRFRRIEGARWFRRTTSIPKSRFSPSSPFYS